MVASNILFRPPLSFLLTMCGIMSAMPISQPYFQESDFLGEISWLRQNNVWLFTLTVSRMKNSTFFVHFLVLELTVLESTLWSKMSVPPSVMSYVFNIWAFNFPSSLVTPRNGGRVEYRRMLFLPTDLVLTN